MKAVAYISQRKTAFVDWPDDESPLGATEIRGRTLVTLVSPGTELNACYDVPRGRPDVGGYAAIFEVEAIGSRVEDLRIGQRVFCLGRHVSQQRCLREDAVAIPKDLDPETAVFARLLGVSWTTLTTTNARPPDHVLVLGLGIVGNLAAQIFQESGYRVTAVEPQESRRRVAGHCRLDDVRETVEGLDRGFALAIDCSGHEAAIVAACKLVRKCGEVVLVGSPWKRRSELTAFDLTHAIFRNYAVVRSGWEWRLPRHPTEPHGPSIFGNIQGAVELLARNRIRVRGLYRVQPPSDCDGAYRTLYQQQDDVLSIVFKW